MKQQTTNREHACTAFVSLDTKSCVACWKCVAACPKKVIGRINLPWHKHARLVNKSACTGCLQCVKTCPANAMCKLSTETRGNEMKRQLFSVSATFGALFSGIATIFTGLLMQVKYHIGNHGGNAIPERVLGISYSGWSGLHKVAIVILTLCMAIHIYQHRNWYKIVLKKRLLRRNQQALTLSLVFIFAAITGLIPWSIHLFYGDIPLRKMFIEVHDKLALILMIYLILHVFNRMKWFVEQWDNLKQRLGA